MGVVFFTDERAIQNAAGCSRFSCLRVKQKVNFLSIPNMAQHAPPLVKLNFLCFISMG
jgi:hypothetical protein